MKKVLFTAVFFLLSAALTAQALTFREMKPEMKYDPVSQNYIMPKGDFKVSLPDKPLADDDYKYLVFTNFVTTAEMNFGQDFYYETIANLQRFGDYTVGAPFSDATFEQYDVSEMEAIIIPLGDYPLNIATNGGVGLIGLMNQMLDAGKKVFLIGDFILFHAFDQRASSQTRVQIAQDFIHNRLGADKITVPAKPDFVSWTSGGTTTWVGFHMRGTHNDPFHSMLINCNFEYIENTGVKFYPLRKEITMHLDIFFLKDESGAMPYMHWTGLESTHFLTDTLTGSRAEFGDGRIIYLGKGVEYYCGEGVREYTLRFGLDWLMEHVPEEGPVISFESSSIDFGTVKVGESVETDFSFSNIGNQPMVVDEAFIDANDGDAFEILEGEILGKQETFNFQDTHTVKFRFTPQEERDYTGWFKIKCNAINKKEIIIWLEGIGGTGSGPKLQINYPDNTIDFGTVWPPNSKEMPLKLHNTGDQELKIEELKIVENDDETFGFPQVVSVPFYIQPQSEIPIYVRFGLRPEAREYNGKIYIRSNAIQNEEMYIDLVAKIGGSGPYLKTNVGNEIDFGTVNIETDKEIIIDIENTGKEKLEFNSIMLQTPGSAFAITEGSDLTELEVGGTAQIKLTFAPDEAKQYSNVLYIGSNAENEPAKEITLTGEGSTSSVWENPSAGLSFLKLTPNPVKETGEIEIRSDGKNRVEIFLTDQNGKIVRTIMKPAFTGRAHKVSFSTHDLSSGTYFIVARSGKTTAALKAVVIK